MLWLTASEFPGGRSREAWATKLSFMGKLQETRWPFSPSSQSQTQVHTSVFVFLGLCLCFPKSCLLYPDRRENLTYLKSLGESCWGDQPWLLEVPGCREDHLLPHLNRFCWGQRWPYRGTEHRCLLGRWGSKGTVGAPRFPLLWLSFPKIPLWAVRSWSQSWGDMGYTESKMCALNS